MRIKTLIWVLLIVLLTINVLALGVGPVYTNIDFEPEFTNEYSFRAYSEGESSVIVSLSGDLTEFITFEKERIEFIDIEEIVFFVELPRDLSPGTYNSRISITQAESSVGMVNVVPSVSHKIFLTVPKHGKYVKELFKKTVEGLNIDFENIGLKNIELLEVHNNFFSVENFSFYHSRKLFESDDVFNISLDLHPGEYSHNLLLLYDGLIKNITKHLIVGSPKILIDDLSFRNFKLGEINELNALLSSNWNGLLKLFVEVDVFNEDGLLESIKSVDFDFYSENKAQLFFDTTGFKEDDYKFVVRVFSGKQVLSEKDFTLTLKSEKAIEKSVVPTNLIFLSISILFLAFIILFLEKKKKKM